MEGLFMKSPNTALRKYWLLACSIGLLSVAQATIIKKGQTGCQFLKLDGSARAAAMGSAYMMTGYDASAMFYNPASLGLMERKLDFLTTSTMYIADVQYYHLALAGNLGQIGNLGLSVVYADYGTIEGTRVAENEQGFVDLGNIDIGAMSVGLAYSRQINDKFTIGGHIKRVNQDLGWNLEYDPIDDDTSRSNNKVAGWAYDFGTIFYPGWKSFRFGMSVRNFSSEYDFGEWSETPGEDDEEEEEEEAQAQEGRFELPLTFAMGVAIDLMDFVGGMDKQSLLLAVDALHPRDFKERLHLGLEYWYHDLVAIRGGYKFNYDTEGLTLGFGLKLAGFRLDYAYSSLKYFDALNRFTIAFGF
jgi:hypothetical protein